MNVILNTDEAHAVLALVSSQVIDHVELSEAARKAIRDWRRAHDVGTAGLEEFTGALNLAIGNYIDERTTRMMRVRGALKVKGV
ncbi:MAG: hypothetical protein C4558_07820 [Dehalococcoidia bacterium]|nr:MAG: hypothetical protein C4558_07820 [Dehalococcoidia bacterium]